MVTKLWSFYQLKSTTNGNLKYLATHKEASNVEIKWGTRDLFAKEASQDVIPSVCWKHEMSCRAKHRPRCCC